MFCITPQAWFSLAPQAQAQEQAQALGMTEVKNAFDANTSTSKIIRIFRHFGKLFRHEVIWILSLAKHDHMWLCFANVLVLTMCWCSA